MSNTLDKVVQYMVAQSVDGVYYGSPRKKMESVTASSGSMYAALAKLGIIREGNGKSAKWKIPPHIVKKYKKG